MRDEQSFGRIKHIDTLNDLKKSLLKENVIKVISFFRSGISVQVSVLISDWQLHFLNIFCKA